LNKEELMHRHIQFAPDGVTVEGISDLSSVLLYFPLTEENRHVTLGWRFVKGEWLPPLPPPEPTEEDILSYELAEVDGQLRRIYDEERFAEWKGETSDTGTKAKETLLSRSGDIKTRLTKLRRKRGQTKGE
jgi:hypothetical protein